MSRCNLRSSACEAWSSLLCEWSVAPLEAAQSFDDVCRSYASPGRFYHTLEHAAAVVQTVERLGAKAEDRKSLTLAAWLHDVVYDSRAADNEERSAEYAERLCTQHSIPDGCRIAALILKTKTHLAGDDADARLLLDADLAILGASAADYLNYADSIRKEYGWVTEPDYRQGRAIVLVKFLNRPANFHVLRDLEAPARQNLTAELSTLRA